MSGGRRRGAAPPLSPSTASQGQDKALATALVVFPENKVILWRHGTERSHKTGDTSAVFVAKV